MASMSEIRRRAQRTAQARRPNQPIEIQLRAGDRTGSIGGQVDAWSKVRDTFAFVEDKTFRETRESGRIVPVQGKQFRIRRDDTLDASNNRIVYNGLNYNIRSLKVDDRNIRSPYTIINADAGVAQ